MFIVLKQLETALRAMKNYIDNIIPKKVSDLQNDAEYITETEVPTPDWTATSSEPGYIDNKPNILPGTGQMSIQTNAGHTVTGTQSASFGAQNNVSGNLSFSVGVENNVSGGEAFAAGNYNIANHESQFVFGQFNAADPSNAEATQRGTYIEIVGNGDGTTIGGEVVRSNARTLDWEGNQWIAGNMKVGGTGYDDSNAVEVATKNDIAIPDWEATFGEDGYITNKPKIMAGTGTGSLRNSNSTAGGRYSFAEGNSCSASGDYAHSEGELTKAVKNGSHAEGYSTVTSGSYSHAEGTGTIANHKSQHVFGEYNIIDPSRNASTTRGTYIEIVGNGVSGDAKSNARTLDWNGNEWLSGTLKVGGTGYTDSNAKEVATKDYVDNAIASIDIPTGSQVISGTWTTPQSGQPYLDYDDSSMTDEALFNMLENNGEGKIILKVAFPNYIADGSNNVTTDTRYFYVNNVEQYEFNSNTAKCYRFIGGKSYQPVDYNSEDFEWRSSSEIDIYRIHFASNDEYEYSWDYVNIGLNVFVDNENIVRNHKIAFIESNKVAFNGLAKAAGDTTQASSGNPIGTYTDTAKTKIKAMLGVTDPVSEIDDTAGSGDTDKTWSADKITSELANAGSVQDVTINGTSVVGQDGVAEIPVASSSALGVVKTDSTYGITINNVGILNTDPAALVTIKSPSGISAGRKPIVPSNQHQSVFYGLAKAAGDTTQSASSNAVGTYTEEAKSAISEMLGGAVSVTGTTPDINAKAGIRYICGEILTLDITLPASGIVDVVFTSGSTPTVLTITPPTGQTVKWANGFDPTSLDTDTTYEINVMDGLGVAASWT